MNIHEYQGKLLLKKYGVAIQEGVVADTPEQAVEAVPEAQVVESAPEAVVELVVEE